MQPWTCAIRLSACPRLQHLDDRVTQCGVVAIEVMPARQAEHAEPRILAGFAEAVGFIRAMDAGERNGRHGNCRKHRHAALVMGPAKPVANADLEHGVGIG